MELSWIAYDRRNIDFSKFSAPFDSSKPDDWPKWIKQFKQYRVASGLSKDYETRQVNTLLYCLEDEVEDVLSSTNISKEDKTNYTMTITLCIYNVTVFTLLHMVFYIKLMYWWTEKVSRKRS